MTASAPVRLSGARLRELGQLVALDRAAFSPQDAYPWLMFASLWLTPGRLFLVARPAAAPDVCGYSVSVRQGWRGAYLVSFAVHPAVQRRGVGRALLAATVEHWRACGRAHLDLHVRADNAAAQALYQAHGFRAGARLRHFYGPHADGLAMRLPLAAPR